MKALKRRLKGIFGLGIFSAIGIAMTWSIALGQATPDPISVPEPASLALLVTGMGILAVVRYRRRK